MRKFISFTLALFSVSAFASKDYFMTCVTEFPTTSIVVETIDKEVVARIFHHNGFKYMPLHSGIITPADLETMRLKAQEFAKIGDEYEFRWNIADCKRQDNEIFSCIMGKPTTINGVEVKPFSIYTRRITSESDAGVFENMEVSFLIDIEKSAQSFSMQYERNECVNFKK